MPQAREERVPKQIGHAVSQGEEQLLGARRSKPRRQDLKDVEGILLEQAVDNAEQAARTRRPSNNEESDEDGLEENEDEKSENQRRVNQWLIDDMVKDLVSDGIKTGGEGW